MLPTQFLHSLLLLSLLAPAPASAQKKIPLVSDVSVQASDEIKFNLSDDGNISFSLVRSGNDDPPGTVFLSLSPFLGPQKDVLPVAFEGNPPPAKSHSVTADTNGLFRVALHAQPAPSAGPYSGTLVISAAGYEQLVLKITLTKNLLRPALLTLSRKDGTIVVTRSLCQDLSYWLGRDFTWCEFGSQPQARVSTTVWDKNGVAPLTGVYARLETMSTTSNNNLEAAKNLTFFMDSAEMPHFETTPAANDLSRDVAFGGQRSIGIDAHDLLSGEYHTTLRFSSTNSTDDDSQKFNLIVIVRDSWVIAVLILLVALAISFVTNKLLKSKKSQLELTQRIRKLTPAWLSSEDPVLPVVWIQAAFRQVQDLAKRYWLTGENLLNSRLDDAEKMITIWDKVRVLKAKIEQSQIPRFVETRLRNRLSKTIAQIGQEVPNDAKAAQIQSQLDGLMAWTEDSTRNKCYWDDVSASANPLLLEIDPLAILETERQIFTDLRDSVVTTLKSGLPGDAAAAAKAVAALDMAVAKLQILWTRRSLDDFSTLSGLLKQGVSDDAFLRIADDLAWKYISNQPLEIVMPETSGADPVEAFKPINVYVTTQDDSWDESFFFQHKLRCEWEFILLTPRKAKKQSRKLRLTPTTVGPRIMQYMPRNGALAVSVRIVRAPGVSKEVPATEPVQVAKSGEFGYFSGLERMEVYSLIFAALFAVITGIGTFYAKSAAWGSFQDYLTLFVWGAGIDQGKNFLQNLQNLSPTEGTVPDKGK
jgi:hypothetical protein